MPIAPMALFEKAAEFLPLNERGRIPPRTRGLYTLLKEHPDKRYEVVYVGMVCGPSAGIRGRLRSHQHLRAGRPGVGGHRPPRVPEGPTRPLAVQRGFKPLKKLARDKGWLRPAGPGRRRKKKSP